MTPERIDATRIIRVVGGYIVYSSSVATNEAIPSFGLGVMPRFTLVSFVAREEGLRLCGAGITCA
jgi:hypothetical protein